MFDGIETGDKRGELRTISCHCLGWCAPVAVGVCGAPQQLRPAPCSSLEFLRDGAELVAEFSQLLGLDGRWGC